MNLQNNKDRDRSGPGFSKPENKLAKDSSETTREATQINLSEYGKAIVAATAIAAAVQAGGKKIGRLNYTSVINQAVGITLSGVVSKEKGEFLEWFIDFVEGDGSFVVQIFDNPVPTALIFTIDQYDRKILDKIQKGLGFGQIYPGRGKNKNLNQYWASSFADVTKLVHLFNGNLTLDKTHARFKRWVDGYNRRFMGISYISSPLLVQSRQPIVTLQSAWLAGFIDAEGSFHAHYRSKPPASIRTKFSISQNFEVPVLKSIRDCLRRSVGMPIKSNSPRHISDFQNDMHRLEFNSLSLFSALHKYLARYPLRGRKRLVYKRWKFVIENRALLKAKTTTPKVLDRYLKLIANLQISKN